MTFYERYAAIAEKHGLNPGSEKAAKMFGTSKSTISKWNTQNTTPLGKTVAAIADAFDVSTDYLLGRTDDPTDFTKKTAEDEQENDLENKEPEMKIIPLRELSIPGISQSFLLLYSRLDDTDKVKIEGVIQGMLMQDKYSDPLLNAAHIRTDVRITEDMVAHDEDIMNDDHF